MARVLQLGAILLLAAASGPAQQKGVAAPSEAPRGRGDAPAPKRGGPRGPAARPPLRMNNPGNRAARLYTASPEQRERVLEKLPPAAQERARKQLQAFDQLPEDQRRMLVRRAERLASLPPGRQREVTRSFQAFQRLPPERKQAVRQTLRRLQAVPEADRPDVLNSDQFKNRFSPEEQKMIQDLSEIILPEF